MLLILLCNVCFPSLAQNIHILESGKNTSLRGLSVLNDSIAWVSGSAGWTAHTSDGGKNWHWQQLEKYKDFDFRDIEVLSEERIILLSAGSPGLVLLSTDTGISWNEVYRNESSGIFLDGMDFRNAHEGMIYGDPIKGQMVLLRTVDAGLTWNDISNQNKIPLIEGEAGFAASGTGIRCSKTGKVWIASGGIQSRIFHSADFGNSWKAYALPIIQGKDSTGPFSIAFFKKKRGIAAGGDFKLDTSRTNNLLWTQNGGMSWKKPIISTFGYRSAVEYINKKYVLATGPTGTDYSKDGGKTWKELSKQGFHAVRKAKSGKMVLLSGSKGRIALWEE